MPFNIGDFKQQMDVGGFLQTNKFDVLISFNGQIAGSFVNTPYGSSTFNAMAEDLNYRCVDATLPGLTLRTSDTNRFGLGVIEKMPFSGNYTDISLSFLCDRYGGAYNFWYSWINYIFSMTGEEDQRNVVYSGGQRAFYTAEYKDNYSATITITVYDNTGEPQLIYNLLKAYPVSMNDTPLSWGDNNNLLKLTTNITFREWSIDNVGGTSPTKISNAKDNSQPVRDAGTTIAPNTLIA